MSKKKRQAASRPTRRAAMAPAAAAAAADRAEPKGIPGRLLAWALVALLLAALVWQSGRLSRQVRASVGLKQAEALTLVAQRQGEQGRDFLRLALRSLRRAQEDAPGEVGIPMAIGSVHLLLGSPQAAIGAYEEALALETRPELYLNLGRAQLAAGRHDEARESFRRALALHPALEGEVPAAFRP